jgi:hypothetical protein
MTDHAHKQLRQNAHHQPVPQTEDELQADTTLAQDTSRTFSASAPLTTQSILHLQRTIGNRAVQRLVAKGMIQRDPPASGSSSARPFSLFPSSAEIAMQLMERDRPILAWLDQHRIDVTLTPQVFRLVRRIRQDVPQAADISTNELMQIISGWGRSSHIPIQLPQQPTGAQGVSPSSLSSAASAGMSLRGTTRIGEQEGSVTVSMSGLTLGLMNQTGTEGSQVSVTPGGVGVQGQGGGTTAGFNVGWTGALNFNVDHGSYHFNASVSHESWQLSLTIGSTSMPDLAGISEVFRNGEQALRNAVRGVASARGASAIQTAVSDNLSAIKSAISTASAIQSVTAGQFRARLQIGGPTGAQTPGSSSSSSSQPGGFTASIVLEFVF